MQATMPRTSAIDGTMRDHAGPAADFGRAAATTDTMRVRHVMSSEVVSVRPDASVQEIAQLLTDNRISSLPVVDRKGRLVGIVSDGDLIRRAEIGTEPRPSWWRSLLHDARSAAYQYVLTHGRKAADVMTPAPVTTIEAAPLHSVAALLARRRLKRLPVMRGERVVGMVSRTDLVRKLASRSGTDARVQAVGDDVLRERAMQRIASLPWNMRIRAINTVVKDGVATVYGWAASDIERRALQVVVENTPGVLRVEDGIHRVPPYV
jgi:CBS domain-containing protein